MGFKESIENHPLVYLVSSVVAATAVSVGVVLFLTSQKLQIIESKKALEITELKQLHTQEMSSMKLRFSSIEWRLGGATDWLDVRSVVVPKQKAATLLTSSNYFDEDSFYARLPEQMSNWIYEKTTELKLISIVQGRDLVRLPPGVIHASTLAPAVHLWRHKRMHRIEGIEGFKAAFPFVLVQKFPHTLFSRMVGISIKGGPTVLPEVPSSRLPDVDLDKIIPALERFYRGDAAGMFLTFQLQLEVFATMSSKTRAELTSIQKKGNLVYAQLESILEDVVVDGKKHREFYLVRELVLISTPNELFIIKTMIPTPDHRSEHFHWISEWFGTFAIPI